MKNTLLYLSLALALLTPATAVAQGGSAKPPPPLKTSEEVVVTQATSGQELRGFLVDLSPTTLAMLVNGQRVEVPLERVLRIEGRNDSVKNGAAYGAAIAGGLTALTCAQALELRYCVPAAIFYTGLGALAGAGVDALHKGRTTIYSKPPSTMALGVAPTRKGARAQLAIRW
jgi:hypothetical protein